MLEAGRDELTAEMRREGLPVQKIWSSDALEREIVAAGVADLDALFRNGLHA